MLCVPSWKMRMQQCESQQHHLETRSHPKRGLPSRPALPVLSPSAFRPALPDESREGCNFRMVRRVTVARIIEPKHHERRPSGRRLLGMRCWPESDYPASRSYEKENDSPLTLRWPEGIRRPAMAVKRFRAYKIGQERGMSRLEKANKPRYFDCGGLARGKVTTRRPV